MIEYKSGERLGYIKKSPHSPECVSSIKYKLSLDCLDQIRYLTGYAGGIKRKEKLLEIEGIHG